MFPFSQKSTRRFLRMDVPIFLLVISFLISILVLSSKAIVPDVHIEVNFSSKVVTSQFSTGLTLVDNTLNFPWGNNDLKAVNRVKSLMKKSIRYVDTPIMGWGLPDPWPEPSQIEPDNLSALDSRLHLILATGATPVLTLNEAPWWMKGQLQSNGTTRLLTQSAEWTDIGYSSRILDNEIRAWLHLVQRIAERYMVPPYNLRYFQIWNELKGYYNPMTNAYDYTVDTGNPNSPSARHGYTYMYNQVYRMLMQVATSLEIPNSSIKVGGPYVVIDTWSSSIQSNSSNMIKPYGIYDQRSLDVIKYWLQHKAGAGFITLDGSNDNKDNIDTADPFTASEKLADITRWIRSLNSAVYIGASVLPIWWAEWYVSPYTNISDNDYNNSIKSFAMIEFIKAGGAVPFLWGGLGEGTRSSGLWNATTTGGGQALPWYYSYQALNEYFGFGTKIYKTTVSLSDSVGALASSTSIMLVNKTARYFVVSINRGEFLLNPYQVEIIKM